MKKKQSFFINIFKGFLIGIGAIIPGLSGGTVAIITGVFEELLEAIANFVLHIRKSMAFVLPIVIGTAIGVFMLSPLLDSFCNHFPILSKYLFCSIACVSTFFFVKKSLIPEYSNKKILSTILGVTTALIISILLKVFQMDFEQFNFTLLLVIGIFLALALVLPAISFSYMLLFFGLYDKTLQAISRFDFPFILPLALGISIGTFLFSKLLLNLINKYPECTYSYVLGFVLCSIADILVK